MKLDKVSVAPVGMLRSMVSSVLKPRSDTICAPKATKPPVGTWILRTKRTSR